MNIRLTTILFGLLTIALRSPAVEPPKSVTGQSASTELIGAQTPWRVFLRIGPFVGRKEGALVGTVGHNRESRLGDFAKAEFLKDWTAAIEQTYVWKVCETMKARVDASYPDNTTLAKAYYGPQAQYGLRSLDRFVAPEIKPDNYAFGYRAREVACLTMLAMTPEEQAKYAELAYRAAMETTRRSQS